MAMGQEKADGGCPAARPSSGANTTTTTAAAATGSSTADTDEHIPSYDEATAASSGGIPTVDSPFNFPTSNTPTLPPYEAIAASSSSSAQKPIAIPQVAPGPSAPFLPAYPPALLAHGITHETWHAFLDTISAFLTAKVSDRAIAHAGDMAKSLGDSPKQYGRSLALHAKTVSKKIARDAKRLDVVGLASGVIGGAISIPMHAVFGAVHTVFSIPATALTAVSQKPRTPLQRAATYAAVASREWLNERGLHAVLLGTKQLADMVHVSESQFLDAAAAGPATVAAVGGNKHGGSAVGTMDALEGHIQTVKILEKVKDHVVVLSAQSLWLVLVPVMADVDESK